MNTDKLPASQGDDYVPNFDEHDEEVLSKGNNRLLYVLVGLILVLVLGYVALPKGTANGQSSATPSFMLDDAAVTATAPTSADSIAAGLKAAPVAATADTETDADLARETRSKTKSTSSRATNPTDATEPTPTPAAEAAEAPVVAAAPEPAPTPVVAAAPAAPVKTTGKIIDENGRPLVGATVLLKGSSKGTSTDANGNYTLEVPAGTENTLIYGYGGYEDEIARTRGTQPMNVTLTPRAKASRKGR